MRGRHCVALRATTVLLVTLLVAFACALPGYASKKYTFYLFEVGTDNPYFLAHMHGAQAAAEKYPDVELIVVDGRNDPATQASQVVQAIARGIDGILLNPITSDALVPACREAKSARIPVVTTDRDISDPSLRVAAVGSDQRLIGQIAGKYAVDFLKKLNRPKPWKVVILEGLPGALANTERTGGWYDSLNPLIKDGTIKIVADVPGDWAREPSVRKMTEILAMTRDIDLILASNDEEAAGAIVALESARVTPNKDVYLIGVDASPTGLQLIKDGKMLATVAHQAYLQGYWGFEMLMKYVDKGVKPPEGRWANNYIITENFMVDKSNVAGVGPFGEPLTKGPMPALPY